MRVAVCDDEKFERERTKELICKYAVKKNMNIEIDCFITGEDLIKGYEKGRYTIIFLDIEMGKTDGIEVADKIRSIPDHDVTIMYITNYPEYMQQSFDVRAAQFFSKPLKYEIFENKMNKVMEYISHEEDKKIFLSRNNEKIIISLSDVCTIETIKSTKSNSDIIITTKIEEIKSKGKLKEYINLYPDKLFFVHRSIVINIQNVCSWMGDKIIMKNGREIRVSRSRLQELKTAFTSAVLREIGR